MTSYRLHIDDILRSEHDWISLEGVPLTSRDRCVCCDAKMSVAGTIASPAASIRLGACSSCGAVGYLDRPEDAWFRRYYDGHWDAGTAKRVEDIKPFGPSRIVSLVREAGVPATARVFEVGTGYGQLLRQFREAGFSSVFGIEHSAHRAKAASAYASAQVFHGDFGDWSARPEAVQAGSFDVVYSKSVMEHMEDPRRLFGHAARIQPEGGLLVIAVPNVLYEPVTITWLFLPHLHAFSARALAELAKANGYVPIKVEEDGKGLVLVARKGRAAEAPAMPQAPSLESLSGKWRDRFALGPDQGRSRVFWWTVNDPDRTGLLPGPFASGAGRRLVARLMGSRLGGTVLRVLFGVARRAGAMVRRAETAPAGEGIEIRMKELRLFVK
jgi:SAM-dependent methyltransferase